MSSPNLRRPATTRDDDCEDDEDEKKQPEEEGEGESPTVHKGIEQETQVPYDVPLGAPFLNK